MKKMFLLVAGLAVSILGLSSLQVNAYVRTNSNPEYQTVYANWLNFKAWKEGNAVKMTWNKFNLPAGEKWHYRKVVRSDKNPNPVYPDDGYIKYNRDINFSSYTDKKYLGGYYRVCAITDKNGQRKRYCSNVVYIKKSYNSDNSTTSENSSNNNTSSSAGSSVTSTDLYAKIDSIWNKFLINLEKNYSIDKQVERLQLISERLEQLKNNLKSNKLKSLVEYLQQKVEETLELKKIEKILYE